MLLILSCVKFTMTAKRKTSEMSKDGNKAQLRNNVSFALHQLAKVRRRERTAVWFTSLSFL